MSFTVVSAVVLAGVLLKTRRRDYKVAAVLCISPLIYDSSGGAAVSELLVHVMPAYRSISSAFTYDLIRHIGVVVH